jgi:membrane-bound serine protease (ClpP class)
VKVVAIGGTLANIHSFSRYLKDESLHCLRLISPVVIGIFVLAASQVSAKDPVKCQHGVIIRFEGTILPGLESYLFRKLETAEKQGADLVILEIDSPGGRLKESLDIAEKLQKVGWAHTVAYIPREAISGAAIAALGCDEILMSPEARIGDAGPIVMGSDSLFRLAPEKIVSYLTNALRGLAEAKNRPPALAEAMADKDLKVHRVRNLKTGKETYISERDLKASPDEWKNLGTIAASGDGRFLALTGQEAAKVGLADALIGNRQELARRFGLSELQVIEPTVVDNAVELLNWWLISGLLLIVGLTGLYMEAMSPGHGVGGLIAGACFLLLFWSHYLGGTADWLEVVLFILGVACIGVEVLVLPGTIVPGLVGAALILVSLVMASQGFLIPETARELHTLAGTMTMIVVSCGIFFAAAVVLTRRMDTLPFLNRLMLTPPDAEPAPGQPSPTGFDVGPVVGDLGVAYTPLRPGGKGRFGERTIDVLACGDFFDRGTAIRVVRVTGNQVLVEGVEEQ